MIKGLKICGVSDPKTLNYILNHPNPPRFIGFITNYEKSRRFIEYGKLQRLIDIDKKDCLLYTSPSPRDSTLSRMPSSA